MYPVRDTRLGGHVPLVALRGVVVLCHGGDSRKEEVEAGGIYAVAGSWNASCGWEAHCLILDGNTEDKSREDWDRDYIGNAERI